MRTAGTAPLRLTGRGADGLLQLHRRLLQSHPTTLRPGVSLAHLLRTGDANRPTVRHPLNRPPKRGNFTVMRPATSLQRHKTARLPREKLEHLGPHQALAEHRPAGRIGPVRLKYPLRNIKPYRASLAHGRLLWWLLNTITLAH